MKRGEVIETINNASQDKIKFLEMVAKHRSKTDSFNLTEFFQALPKKQCVSVWKAMLVLTQEWVESIDDDQVLSEGALNVLDGVVLLIQSAMATNDPVTPPSLRDTLQILHDILLGPLEVNPDLQNAVSQLCEGWWCEDRMDKDDLVPHTLLYVVARSLTDGAVTVDVKRVWAMRQAFLLLDFEDTSAEPFKTMLLSTTLQPHYINSEEGRKFLSFLFGMHPLFLEDLHKTIKYQIPYMSNSLLETYGDVYLRAWRLASGPYLKLIEEQCLQDLMFSAVHAPRQGQRSLFSSLRKLLERIHSQRVQKGVTAMLHRLYSPFLWRSLKVANPEVRANACTLLLDAFPLQDPNNTREQNDQLLQKQFDGMTELLADQSVMVRVSAVMGVCRILCYYWEMLPALVIKSLLGRLVTELAWDSAAVAVRVAVVQGLCLVLENRLSHSLMAELLPLLQNLLHDSAEKVRTAMLELLLLVKGMKMIKFWHICPLEQLLARVEVDSVAMVKRIVALLIDSFQPSKVSPSQQIERCVDLLRVCPGAARRFYQLAVSHLSPAEVTKFILAILSAVMECVECESVRSVDGALEEEGDSEMEIADRDEEQSGVETGGWKESNEDTENVDSEYEPLSLSDESVMCGLLETMVVLWEGVRERLDQRGNKGTRRKLEGHFIKCLPLLFNTFKDGPCRLTLYLLAANLPKSAVKSIATGTLTTLSAMSHPIKFQDYSSLLLALTSWGDTVHVINLINEWLKPELHSDSTSATNREKPKPKRRGRAKDHGSPPVRQPLLAVELINWMLSHPCCLQELKGLPDFWNYIDLLKNSMSLLELHYLSNPANHQSDQPTPSFQLLHKCLALYIRLCMHRQAEGIEGGGLAESLEEVLSWADRVLIHALQDTQGRSSSRPSRQSSRKRKVSQSHLPPPLTPSQSTDHAHKVTEMLLLLLSEVLMLGLVTGEEAERLEMSLVKFGANVAETSSAHVLLSSLCKLLYQLFEASAKSEVAGISSTTGSLTQPASLLRAVLEQLLRVAETKPELLTKSLSQIKGCVGGMVSESLRLADLSSRSQVCDKLPTIETLVRATLRDQIRYMKQTPGAMVPVVVNELPPLVACLVKLCCGSKHSTSVFLSHMEAVLCEDEQQPPDLLLTHQASLCLVSALAQGVKHDGVEVMLRIVRQAVKIAEKCSEEGKQEWSPLLAALTSLSQSLQETLLSK